MAHLPRDDLRDFDLDGGLTGPKIRWHGGTVEVTARLVPRYLWTTASIDVFLDGRCILRTGGQMKMTGSSSAEFRHDGAVHTVELSWDHVRQRGFPGHGFPYQLRIDGAKVAAWEVPVHNAGLLFVPTLALVLLYPFLLALLLSRF
jgi:hypothetical protein